MEGLARFAQFRKVTPADVKQALERVKTTDSCGIDGIPMHTIEQVIVEVINLHTWYTSGRTGFSKLLASLELGPGSWELGAGRLCFIQETCMKQQI